MSLGYNCFYCKAHISMTPAGAKRARADDLDMPARSDCALIDRSGNLFACNVCRRKINEKKREDRQAKEQRDKEHWDSIQNLFGEDE